MILKQVIKYDNAVAIEATWIDENDVTVRSTAYSGDQMDLFRADVAQYGGDISLYEDLIAQIEADFVPEPPQPAPIPNIVTMRQARLALLQSNLLSSVDAAIASLPSPQKEAAQIEWEYSQEVHRDKELVGMLAPALGLTEAQLDDLFTLAASL